MMIRKKDIVYKKLYSAPNYMEAYLLKGILEQSSIAIQLLGENLAIAPVLK